MQETQGMRGPPLGREDPLEEGAATHSSTPARKTPCTEEPGRLQSMEWHRVRYDWTWAHTHTHTHTHIYPSHNSSTLCLYEFAHSGHFVYTESSARDLLCLASFSQHCVFWDHPRCSMYHYFIPFHDWIIFHCMDILVLFVHLAGYGHFVVPTFWLLQIMLLCTFMYRFLCARFHLFCL